MAEFQKGDVVWIADPEENYNRVGVVESPPYESCPYVKVEGEGWFSPDSLTLIGGPRMKFLPGDVVDVAEYATTGGDFVSYVAGQRCRVVSQEDFWEHAIRVKAADDLVGLPKPEYVTLVKREGYIDRTADPVVAEDATCDVFSDSDLGYVTDIKMASPEKAERDYGPVLNTIWNSGVTATFKLNEYNPEVAKLVFGDTTVSEETNTAEEVSVEQTFLNNVSSYEGTWSGVIDDDSLVYVVDNGPAYRVWVEKL